MDNDAVQTGASEVPRREPAYDEDYQFGHVSRQTRERDKNHLITLSVFYYVLAGFAAFGVVMSLLYVPFGFMFIMAAPTPGGPPPELGYFFIGLGIFSLVLNGVYAWFLYLAGKSLREYRRRTLIFVMAILLCAGFPGIILGIFTIVVLNRESVKDLFLYGDPASPRYENGP